MHGRNCRYRLIVVFILSLTALSALPTRAHADATLLFQGTWGIGISNSSGPGNTMLYGTGIVADPQANLYLVGAGEGAALLLAKFDPIGTPVWSEVYASSISEFSQASGIARDRPGNIFMVGDHSESQLGSDILLAKFDMDGGPVWDRGYSYSGCSQAQPFGLASEGCQGRAVSLDQLGNVYLTASSSVSPSPVVLLKVNSTTGDLIWERTWHGNYNDQSYGVATDSSGNIYVTGATLSYGAGDSDVFLLKFNSTGTLVWQRTWGGAYTDQGRGVAVDSSGNVYVTGYTNSFGEGSYDAFLLRLNATGGLVWQRTWGGSGDDQAYAISVDSLGSIYLTGSTQSFGAGSSDAFLLKFDSTGSVLWQKTWGGPSYDVGNAVVANVTGDAFVTGYVTSVPPSSSSSTYTVPSLTLGAVNITLGTPSFALGTSSFQAGTGQNWQSNDDLGSVLSDPAYPQSNHLNAETVDRTELSLFGYGTCSGCPTTGNLTVLVHGPDGPIDGATVAIVLAPSGQALPSQEMTGTDGSVGFRGLLPGSYTYQVTAAGYQTSTGLSTVTAGKTQSSGITLSQLQQTPPTPPAHPTSDMVYFAIGLVSIAVILVGVLLAVWTRRAAPDNLASKR